MTTYADLLYDAAGFMGAEAAHLDRQSTTPPKPWLDGAIRRLREQADLILNQLRESTNGTLSPEDISRIEKCYDPSGTAYSDVFRLIRSHEAMRQAQQTADSIAKRYKSWWPQVDHDGQPIWWNRNIGADQKVEPMTPDQVAWFKDQQDG